MDENYSGEESHEQCEEILKAASQYVDTYISNFSSWECVVSCTKVVNVGEWMKGVK